MDSDYDAEAADAVVDASKLVPAAAAGAGAGVRCDSTEMPFATAATVVAMTGG